MPIEIELTSQFGVIAANLRPAARAVVARTAYDIQRRAQLKISTGPKTGRVYVRGGAQHQASAPGEAPATDTGFLVNTIQVGTADLEAYVDVFAEYAAPLEYGTVHMAARPFLSPSVEEAREGFEQGMSDIFGVRAGSTLQTRGLDMDRAIDPGELFL